MTPHVKTVLTFLLVLIFTTQSYGQEELPNDYEYLKLEMENTITFGLEYENDPKLNFLRISSYTLPVSYEDAQYLNSFNSSHNDPIIKNESNQLFLLFKFHSLPDELTTIKNTFHLESVPHRPQVTQIVPYPPNYVTKNDEIYLEFTDLIDTNNAIKNKASELAQGETDVYVIATKIAGWIRGDITYDLSTVTANPDQTSTQVFLSKAGVCKEITHLYISMLRSLGIPARVISGYSYTDSPEVVDFVGSNWGGHAWAEVLIGDVWVPFDLTYNQYGYVDATHIILDKSNTLRPSSVQVNASGHNLKLANNALSTHNTFSIIDKKEMGFNPGFIYSYSGPQELGFGSYGYINVTIENTNPYYGISYLNVASPEEITFLGSSKRLEVFTPNEIKTLTFHFKIDDNLNSKYKYTFPITFYNSFIEEEYSISSQSSFDILKENSLPEEISENLSESFTTNSPKSSCILIDAADFNIVQCHVSNTNNFEIEDGEFCFEEACEPFSLRVLEDKLLESITYSNVADITIKIQNETHLHNESPIPTSLNSKIIYKDESNAKINFELDSGVNSTSIELQKSDSTLLYSTTKIKDSFTLSFNENENDFLLVAKLGEHVLARKTLSLEKPLEPEPPTIWERFVNFINAIIDWI